MTQISQWYWNTVGRHLRRLTHPSERPIRNCANRGDCRGRRHAHGTCYGCRRQTCSTALIVDPHTLRRARRRLCPDCRWRSETKEQTRARDQRRSSDWRLLTDPISTNLIRPGYMSEQFAGPVRSALRAFAESDAATAHVPNRSASELNESIKALGLVTEMYAETRNHQTILRRLPAP